MIRPCSSGEAVMHPNWAHTRRQPKKIKKARNPDMAACCILCKKKIVRNKEGIVPKP
jgi:hypothetical protein